MIASQTTKLFCQRLSVGEAHEPSLQACDRSSSRKGWLWTARIFEVFNGPLWEPLPVHICHGCCSGPVECRKKMIRAIKQLLFRARPSVPAVNRWSKLGPALDIVLPLVLVHDLMHKLLEQLGSASGAGEDADHAMADDELDEALKSEFDFAKLQGLRYKASLSYFGNASTSSSLLVLALCLEPIRSVSAWWMRRARTGDTRLRDGSLDMLFELVPP